MEQTYIIDHLDANGDPWSGPPITRCHLCKRTETEILCRSECTDDTIKTRYYEGAELQDMCSSCFTIMGAGKGFREEVINDITKKGVVVSEEYKQSCKDDLCIDCGYSSLLETLRVGVWTEWVKVDEYGPNYARCPSCYERNERYLESLASYIVCQYCNKEWDGRAQCPCDLEEELPYDDIQEFESVYDGEIELEEDEIIENNSEQITSVKNTIKQMGDILFDSKENISEGLYLELMDSLQKLTNQLNDL